MSNKGIQIRRDSNASFYDNSPDSPLPPPNLYSIPSKQNDTIMGYTNRTSSSSGTPPSKRKARLGHQSGAHTLPNGSSNSTNQLVVTVNPEKNGTPVTTLLKSPALPQNPLGRYT